MNATFLHLLIWTGVAGATGGAVWYHKQPRILPEEPDVELRLYDRQKDAPKVVAIDKTAYKQVMEMPWVTRRPPPEKIVVVETTKKSPFHLMRVVNNDMVELLNTKDNSKQFYKRGDSIRERLGTKMRDVGKVLRVERDDEQFVCWINWQGTDYPLGLRHGMDDAYAVIGKVKNKRILDLSQPNKLSEHEGKIDAPNSYVLTADFFNAIMDNSVTEMDKIKFAQDPQGNFLITELADDSVMRKIGFKDRDVLLAFDGKRVKGLGDMKSMYVKWVTSGNAQAKIRVMRSGKAVDMKIRIDTKSLGKYDKHFRKQPRK